MKFTKNSARFVTVAKNENNSIEPANPFRVRNLFYLLGAILFFLAIVSHDARDIAVLAGGVPGVVSNWIGTFGARLACSLLMLFGLASYLIAAIVLLAAIRSFLPQKLCRTWFFLPGVMLSVVGASILLAFDPTAFAQSCESLGLGRSGAAVYALSGGSFGQILSAPGSENVQPGVLRLVVGPVGCILISSTLLLAGLIMLYRSEWHSVLVHAVDLLLPAVDDSQAGEKEKVKPARSSEREKDKDKMSFAERVRQLTARNE